MIDNLFKSNCFTAIIEIFLLNQQLLQNNENFDYLFSIQEEILYSIKNIILSGIGNN